MGAKETEPSLMRNLGAFFGHIVQAIKEDPTEPASTTRASTGARASARASARDVDRTHRTHPEIFVEHEDACEIDEVPHRSSVADSVAWVVRICTMR